MASLKKAIEDKCKDCTYDKEAPGTWREQVEGCRVTKCPLWEVRPLTVNTVNVRRGKAALESDSGLAKLLAELPDDEEEAVS